MKPPVACSNLKWEPRTGYWCCWRKLLRKTKLRSVCCRPPQPSLLSPWQLFEAIDCRIDISFETSVERNGDSVFPPQNEMAIGELGLVLVKMRVSRLVDLFDHFLHLLGPRAGIFRGQIG